MAESYLDMIFRTKKEGSANKQVADELGTVKDKSLSAGDAFEKLTGVSLGAAAAFGMVAGALKFSISAAMEAEGIQADLNATLKSTKGAAGMTADEINRLATNLSEMSGIEDDSIVKAQAMLLTFTNIGRDVFPMASEAMVNMSAKFGSLDAASMQLGKALNDPIAGVGALRKVGVALTDQQEASIKKFVEMGDVASAQKVILGELEVEFGGLAEAMGGTTEGSINKLKNTFGNLAETIGGKLLPYLKGAADTLNLLLTADERVKNALEEHEDQVFKTAESYELYRAEKIRSAQAAGILVDAEGNLFTVIQSEGGAITTITGKLDMHTQAEYDSAQGAKVMAAALEDSRAAAQVTGAGFDEFASSLGRSSGVVAGTAKIIKDQLSGSMKDVTRDMEAMTTKMIYSNIVMSIDNPVAARKVAESLGLINQATVISMDAIDGLVAKFLAGEISEDKMAAGARRLGVDLGLIPRNIDINIRTNYSSTGIPGGDIPGRPEPDQSRLHNEGDSAGNGMVWHWTGSSWTRVIDQNADRGTGYAAGADFIVPPGFMNDSYPMRVQSGERVIVIPQGQVNGKNGINGKNGVNGMGATNVYFNTTINNEMDEEVFKRKVMQVFGY